MEAQQQKRELVRAIEARHTAVCRKLVAVEAGKSPEGISAAALARAVREFEAELAEYPDLRRLFARDVEVLETMARKGKNMYPPRSRRP